MTTMTPVQVMRILIGEAALHDGKPVYECLVEAARRRGLAGATVTRGFMGFGAKSLLHTSRILRLSEDLPVVVEIVDVPARIADFLPVAEDLVGEGTIVVEEARAIFHLPLRIRDVMSPDVVTVGPGTPLTEVADLLLRRQVKAVPVLDGGRIVGIVTGGDLLSRGGLALRLDIHGQLPEALRREHRDRLADQGLTAGDIMTAPVETLNVKTTVPQALTRMARRACKRLPVVDDSGNLMGIVSRVDLLRAVGRAAAVTPDLGSLPPGLSGCARDAMFTDVPTARPDTPVGEVLDLLLVSPLRRVVIVDGQWRVVGIVLDRDLVAQAARRGAAGFWRAALDVLAGKRPQGEELTGTAAGIMRTEVFTLPPDTPLDEVVRQLVDKKVKRLVVADAAGRLLGMVDRDAVLRALAGTDVSPGASPGEADALEKI